MLDGIMGFVSDNTGLLEGGGTPGMVLLVLKFGFIKVKFLQENLARRQINSKYVTANKNKI